VLSKKENQLPQALVEVHFLKDEIILEEGEIRNSFYISYDGQVTALYLQPSPWSCSSQRPPIGEAS